MSMFENETPFRPLFVVVAALPAAGNPFDVATVVSAAVCDPI